jgi:putative membrane protein
MQFVSSAILSSMSPAFTIFGTMLVALAALFHVYVFTLESLTWSTPKTWKTFGVASQEHADVIAPIAFNQGFYNHFLAVGALLGIALLGINSTIGFTLMLFSAFAMVGAGVVLFFSVKTSRRAAIMQAGPPLLGVLFILAGRLL